MNRRMKSLSVLLALYSGMAFGQATNSADVTGTVTDTTGAVIPGVKVTVKDWTRIVERVITSNGAGVYDSGPIVRERSLHDHVHAEKDLRACSAGPWCCKSASLV